MADKQVHSINPATGDVIETFAPLTGAGIESALAKAEDRFRSWRRVPLDERAALMNGAAEVLGGVAGLTPQTSGALYFDKEGGISPVTSSTGVPSGRTCCCSACRVNEWLSVANQVSSAAAVWRRPLLSW